MKLDGHESLTSSPAEVWERINDPAVLKHCAPGLEELVETSPDRFDAVLDLALPALSGNFTGKLEFVDRDPERKSVVIRFSGKGGPGFVNGEAELRLTPAEGEGAEGTEARYVSDVNVGGQIARLGQRMISGVAREMAGQFFEAIDRYGQTAVAPPSQGQSLLQLIWRSILNWLGLSRRS